MSQEDDRRRYLIIGSVMIEVVSPLLRQKLENLYQQHVGSLKDFLNTQSVKHTLFHLRHRNTWCCTDRTRCVNGRLPLYHSQWDLLYAENPGQTGHNCHCKYTAKAVQLDDLDITLVSLILLNCCPLHPVNEHAIRKLRQFKNELFSHNTTGRIQKAEYDSHWGDIMTFVLQIDPSKQDDLIRLQNRPLDDLLCTKYFTVLLDVHELLDKMGVSIEQLNVMMQRNNPILRRNNVLLHTNNGFLHANNGLLHTNIDCLHANNGFLHINNGLLKRNNASIDRNSVLTEETNDLLQQTLAHLADIQAVQTHHQRILSAGKDSYVNERLKLGEEMFIADKTLSIRDFSCRIEDILLLDDGQIIAYEFCEKRIILLHHTGNNDMHAECIPLPFYLRRLRAINISVVAVAYWRNNCIDIYDVKHWLRLKSITLNTVVKDMTTINGKIVVAVESGLLIFDYKKCEDIWKLDIGEYDPSRIYAFDERIFFIKHAMTDKTLYCYSNRDKTITKTLLPEKPLIMTSLHDGSLYVGCIDCVDLCHSLLHVSSDCKMYKRVNSPFLESLPSRMFCYNQALRKMVVSGNGSTVYVLNEK